MTQAEKQISALMVLDSDQYSCVAPSAQVAYVLMVLDADNNGILRKPRAIARSVISNGDVSLMQTLRDGKLISKDVADRWYITNWPKEK